MDYETPNTLGLDRIALAAAALCKYSSVKILFNNIMWNIVLLYNLISGEGVFNGGEFLQEYICAFKSDAAFLLINFH